MTAAEALEEKLVVPDAAELVTATATAQSSCVLSPHVSPIKFLFKNMK